MPKQLPVLTLIYEKWEDLTYVIVSLLFQKVPTSPNVILYGINMKAGNPARKLQAICLNLP